ncbi:MAG: Holliday junction branch migration protein RuvA [Clostridiales bacterium]|nr:Holliday junction branch migration protein RuvA [Clostridiales bacterium]
MISFIKGELADIKKNYIVLECNNIGYEIFLPASAIMELPPRKSTVKIYTYLHVKEDGLSLYGFLTRDDLEMFKLLITVNGIGPKGALGILSGITADEIRFAILAEDTRTLAKAPGIGAKTAGKIILELRDKLKLEEAFEQKLKNEAGRLDSGSIYGKREEAISALMALGYSSSEAYRIVTQIEITDDMSTEDIIKLCLKKI